MPTSSKQTGASRTRKRKSPSTHPQTPEVSEKKVVDCWEFPAIQGIQCGRMYWTTMIPWRQIAVLCPLKEEKRKEPANLRNLVQRSINWSRVKKLVDYLINGYREQFYVLSSLTLTFDSDVEFEETSEEMGLLRIAKDAVFHIADGQHRAAAIARTLQRLESEQSKLIYDLVDETIAVTLFLDVGSARKQQIFLDLNQYVCKPNSSLFTLFDHRSPVSDVTRDVLFEIAFLETYVAHEHTSIPRGNKQKLLPLNALEKSTALLLAGSDLSEAESLRSAKVMASDFWRAVCKHHPVWQQATRIGSGEALRDLREQSIAFHAITLNALGLVGARLREMELPDGESWLSVLRRLEQVNWLRSNAELEGLIMLDGKIVKNNANCRKLADYLLKRMFSNV